MEHQAAIVINELLTGAELEEWREALRMTREELAGALGFTFSTVTRWEVRGPEFIEQPLLRRAMIHLQIERAK